MSHATGAHAPQRPGGRRSFLRGLGGVAAALALAPDDGAAFQAWTRAQGLSRDTDSRSDADVAGDEAYWARVRQAYDLNPSVLNFDHGWTNPAPRDAMQTLGDQARELEALPAEMLPKLWDTVSATTVKASLAAAMGVPAAEIALVRNATEALNTVLLGLPLRAGDEIVCSSYDYFAMLDALHQRQARDGVVLRIVRPPVPAPSMQALEDAYRSAIGSRTRLVLLTHPSNLTGQLLPVRRIAAHARAAGARTVVDGAQSLGVLDDPVRSLDCDYYGASAHKWLGTPVGLGVLWMRPEHAGRVWPLVPPPAQTTGMARFEWIGTSPEYITVAALPAIRWHLTIGAGRKAARLRHLAAAVRSRVRAAAADARFYATDDPDMTCGLTVAEIPGVDPSTLQQRLRQRHDILVQSMADNPHAPDIQGVRFSPNVYSAPGELDRLGRALAIEIAALRDA